MGRPEPCVLFAHSFVHSHLDEYVDEVQFTEPVIITACEFLEQSASSSCPSVTITGSSSPPSFALEAFVQCEGEPRFRRLCQPFLYSQSSSNVLEVEAVVTNHLVVRGSYRSLTLVIYGNTTEDMGQFSMDFDVDSSMTNLIYSPAEGKLEDLPPALQRIKLCPEESILPLKSLFFLVAEPELAVEMRQLLRIILRICQVSQDEETIRKVVKIFVSAVSSFLAADLTGRTIALMQDKGNKLSEGSKGLQSILIEAKNELFEVYKLLPRETMSSSAEISGEYVLLEDGVEPDTQELLTVVLKQYFEVNENLLDTGISMLSRNEKLVVGLSALYLICSTEEHFFQFVNGGGVDHLVGILCDDMQKSTAIHLMLLGVVERATRYAIGCEGFLGWWPHEDEHVPAGCSKSYSRLLKFLLCKQRHDVASLATYILHRLRFYEVASKFESAVLSLLGSITAAGRLTDSSTNTLVAANNELKKLLKLLNMNWPIDDPSPVASVRGSSILDQEDGLLSYKATIKMIASSKYSFAHREIDAHLLSLLKERGFLPLAAALLSSPILRSATGRAMDFFVDITTSFGTIVLSLLFCRSGLIFLLHQPEASAAMMLSMQGVGDVDKAECLPIRYAMVLLSKGFFCRPQDVGVIVETHLRLASAIDRLVGAAHHSEELLWTLWELSALSRSDSGRQAMLTLRHFPEAISVLMDALRSVKEPDPVGLSNGTSPLSLAIFHSAAELFEVIVTDTTASSLASWIEHAVELHKALHLSSPGSNRKDAPIRLLEWVDAGVVYHRKGALGLLRYAAVLASGGDAHLTSSSVLVSDSMDVENVVGDSTSDSDVQVVESLLGKLVSDNFDGAPLRDSSISQLTATFRILAFIAGNPAVAAALYEEGAVTVIYIVLINCRLMLGHSSSTYDYLVDEGAECNATSDLLLERSRDQRLMDLLVPALFLLITLLQKLQETGEQHRNTKLVNALLFLHREISPKLASCAADLSFSYPGSALGLGAVCHLLVSALACWPVFGWTPGLFHCLLESNPATASLALGPKEACSLLCLLGDLFPDEGIWLWKSGTSSLNALRTLGVGASLGPHGEWDVDWYLRPPHFEKLLSQLAPFFEKISQIVLQFAFTALDVIQDMLRVFTIRIARQKSECALVLLRPIISWLRDHAIEASTPSETDVFKVQRLLDFLASLLEHPSAKTLLLKEGIVELLVKMLGRCYVPHLTDGVLSAESKFPVKCDLVCWCLPIFISFALICDSEMPLHPSGTLEKCFVGCLSTEDLCSIALQLLNFCPVLPVGGEMRACLSAFKALVSQNHGRVALSSIVSRIETSVVDAQDPDNGNDMDQSGIVPEDYWRRTPPLLNCWKNILHFISAENRCSMDTLDIINILSSGALSLCAYGESLQGISSTKFLFGVRYGFDAASGYNEEKLIVVHEMISVLDKKANELNSLKPSVLKIFLDQVKGTIAAMLLLLEKPVGSIQPEDVTSKRGSSSPFNEILASSEDLLPHLSGSSLSLMNMIENEAGLSILSSKQSVGNDKRTDSYYDLGGLGDKFVWECPDSSPDRLSMPAPLRRKVSSVEGSNRRQRGDNLGVENPSTSALNRTGNTPNVTSGPTRRDTFRQRKPNTSRPPSMHVDDYVARERNIDGVSSGSNATNSIQRGGSMGGRPPSIHVDEFMARQKERQNPAGLPVTDLSQVKNMPLQSDNGPVKSSKSRQFKSDLDDDLHEIDIVFDGETETDDVLQFPQSDDNLPQAPVILSENNSPGSLDVEADSDMKDSKLYRHSSMDSSNRIDGDDSAGNSSRRSLSRAESSRARDVGTPSEKKHQGLASEISLSREQFDDKRNAISFNTSQGYATNTNNYSFQTEQFYDKSSSSPSKQSFGDMRLASSNFQYWDSQHQTGNIPIANASGFYDQKLPPNQPPLPPLPPPSTVSSVINPQVLEPPLKLSPVYINPARDIHPPIPSRHPFQALEVSGASTTSVLIREDRAFSHNTAAGLLLPPPSSSALSDSVPYQFSSQVQSDPQSAAGHHMTSMMLPHPVLDKPLWNSTSSGRSHDDVNASSSGTGRPQPPLPPTPPPFSTPGIQAPVSFPTSQSSIYSSQTSLGALPPSPSPPTTILGTMSSAANNQTSSLQSPLPSFVPPLPPGRPSSLPANPFGSATMQQGQNQPSQSHSIPSVQPSIQSVQPRPPLPPQPPHLPRPPLPPQHPRPPMQVSQQQSERGVSMQQTPIQLQVQPTQIPQPLQVPQIHVFYQPHQSEPHMQHQPTQVEHIQAQNLQSQGDQAPQQQQELGMNLGALDFNNPEIIQWLLSDQERLRQLLEQHPKLMQMLQERMNQ
ncbi:uncharacterized protein LOC18429037 [Amborella trichopoda]|uniref:Virilizer N-terminal domain-containing protein n=1 Tax=Amborella trichopoda TaxID=13333 RepID=W1NZ79_AMBTC|nr:uncharacterized protein LOC18429037 [Amborella trichopoda]XP_020520202.1 uncharacterized protein LOC18429037 [Amborella trichopoda]XP_020520203.1 uncharacterized protein LOC18429037 [Amborella trichopoda]XP_020520204.1 uncharacterized protein LOC18429037 [Amborella trichopoda]ERN00963.1 hypothetical protein AMTR_s00002p00079350 [Amborella trichopoda]|eukprot:XP_006838394.1 uncharacterized protein LOC18429037 [Amborella trichopoda]